MIFLQPFDTYKSDQELKNVKLLGYAVICFLAYLSVFPFELLTYKRLNYWTIGLEILSLVLFVLLANFSTYVYHHLVYDGPALSFNNFTLFTTNFSWGFIILMLPVLIYSRKNFGDLSIATPSLQEKEVEIKNQSGSESIHINSQRIILVESQQNYVNIHHLDDAEAIQIDRIRNTLSNVSGQLDNMVPTHRSFLVNLQMVEILQGSKRKAELKMKYGSDAVPVSQQYYESIRQLLQNRP